MFFAHLHLEGSIFMFQPKVLEVKHLEGRNIAVVQRLSSQVNLRAIQLFKQMKMKIIYDLDDDIWSVPSYNPAFKLMKAWIPGFEICAGLADLVTVSTEHLRLMVKKALGKNCPRVEVLENAVDFDWFHPVDGKYRKKRNGRIVIGWAGTNTHEGDIERVMALMPSILRENPEVDFEIIGHSPSKEFEEFGGRVRERYFVPVAEFAANWAGWQWDISLAPVAENEFNMSKSNIKMIEAAAIRIPCVASNFGEYSKFASHSKLLKEAIMASTQAEWKRKITRLVRDAEYRQNIGSEMYRVGLQKYDIRHRVEKWNEMFQMVLE